MVFFFGFFSPRVVNFVIIFCLSPIPVSLYSLAVLHLSFRQLLYCMNVFQALPFILDILFSINSLVCTCFQGGSALGFCLTYCNDATYLLNARCTTIIRKLIRDHANSETISQQHCTWVPKATSIRQHSKQHLL